MQSGRQPYSAAAGPQYLYQNNFVHVSESKMRHNEYWFSLKVWLFVRSSISLWKDPFAYSCDKNEAQRRANWQAGNHRGLKASPAQCSALRAGYHHHIWHWMKTINSSWTDEGKSVLTNGFLYLTYTYNSHHREISNPNPCIAPRCYIHLRWSEIPEVFYQKIKIFFRLNLIKN